MFNPYENKAALVEFLLESSGCFIGSSEVMSPSGCTLWGLGNYDSPSPDIDVASWHQGSCLNQKRR
jgi:hypothetical protein